MKIWLMLFLKGVNNKDVQLYRVLDSKIPIRHYIVTNIQNYTKTWKIYIIRVNYVKHHIVVQEQIINIKDIAQDVMHIHSQLNNILEIIKLKNF